MKNCLKGKKVTQVPEKLNLKCIKDFELNLSVADAPATTIRAEAMTTADILQWPDKAREKLKSELEELLVRVFEDMPEEQKQFAAYYFKKPEKLFQRQVILFRDHCGKLVATTILDQGSVQYNFRTLQGIHMMVRAVLPEYQSSGIGKTIAAKMLMELQPDVLFTTCAQSSSLHSWIQLVQKGVVTGFEVYPRFEENGGAKQLVTVPFTDIDFAVTTFKQVYIGFADGQQDWIDNAIRNLTVLMTRKNIHMPYVFHPWEKNGRKDELAAALGISRDDGMLVMFKKKTNGHNG
ncbi:MAG: hypothetical protein PHQ97_13620 [Desulfobacterales bacterium]|nr:hypothetical protein [Desulfobacterales bacterium]